MKSKLLHDHAGERTFAVIFDKGDEPVSLLKAFAKENSIGGARLSAIGAFQRVTLGYFDRPQKEYVKIPVDEQVEVLSLLGDVALKDGEPAVHAHVVVGRWDGTTRGGHLLQAEVWPTLEVMIVESPRHLHKEVDAETGLALIKI